MAIYFDREQQKFIGVTEQTIKDLQQEFKERDVVSEFFKMRQWLLSNPANKTVGSIQFIRNWLKKGTTTANYTNKLLPFIDTYLKDLWKGRERLLTLNTISH